MAQDTQGPGRKPRSREEKRLGRQIVDRLRKRYLVGPHALESERALAEHLGLSQATVNGWFRGSLPETATLHQIAWRDGWNLNYLLLGEGPQLRRDIPVGHHLDEEALLRDYARKEVEKYLLWRLKHREASLARVQADLGEIPLTRFKTPTKRAARR